MHTGLRHKALGHPVVIVIVISRLLKCRLKPKCRAPAYSRALLKIRGIVQRIVQSKFRSDFQRVRGYRVAVYNWCRLERKWEDGGSDESGYEFLKREETEDTYFRYVLVVVTCNDKVQIMTSCVHNHVIRP